MTSGVRRCMQYIIKHTGTRFPQLKISCVKMCTLYKPATLLAAFVCLSLFIAGFGSCCQSSSFNNIQNAVNFIQSEVNNLKCCCNDAQPDPCSEDLIAYYPFDRSYRDFCYGNNGLKEGTVELRGNSGVKNGAAYFNAAGLIRIVRLNNYNWGSNFSVSLWFKRTGDTTTYQGLINNGFYSHGSWEIRMGREQNGQEFGGGVITQSSSVTWDYRKIKVTFNHWHHVVMAYNGNQLDFYLDNHKEPNNNCCQGNVVTKVNDVVIGQAGAGTAKDYFYGYIDEVKLYKKWLSPAEVQDLYQLKNV